MDGRDSGINIQTITVKGMGASNVDAKFYVDCEGCAWCSSVAQSIACSSSGTKGGGFNLTYLNCNVGKLIG